MHGSTRSWAMTQAMPDDLWRDFPKTATAFEARFATEEDCRAYWIEARWSGEPACARCNSTRVWTIREGTTFECADCGHQTSLTSGTLLEKTRKPFKMWFRAVFEISTRRTGISAKDLQRIMGFGSYKTAWSWLHKLRAAMVRPDREPLRPFVQADETLVGGKGSPSRRLRLAVPRAGAQQLRLSFHGAAMLPVHCPAGCEPGGLLVSHGALAGRLILIVED